MAGGGNHDYARPALEGGPQSVGQSEVAEVVGGELRFPTGTNPRLGTGHDTGIVDQHVDMEASGKDAFRE